MANKEQLTEALRAALSKGDKPLAEAIAKKLQGMTEDQGLGNAVRHGLQQSATFGWADEAGALGRTFLDPIIDKLAGVPEEYRQDDRTNADRNKTYEMYLQNEREQIESGRQHHGGAMLAAELVAGVVPGVAAAIPKAATSAIRVGLGEAGQQALKKQLPRLAAAGAGYGAVAGAGYANEDKLRGAGEGALWGAGLGVGLPIAGAGVKRGAQNIARRFGAAGTGNAAEEAARRQILKDLRREGLTPKQAAEVLRANPDYYLADVGKTQGNLGDTLEHIMQNPGEGRERIRESVTNRQMQAIDRMQPALREGIENSPLTSEGMRIPTKYNEVEKAITSHAEELGKPLWEKAYKADVRLTPWLQHHLRGTVKKDGTVKYADERIQKVMPKVKEMIANRISNGEIKPNEPGMQARFLDEIQRALRDKASATGAKAAQQTASSRRGFHQTFVKEMEKVMGEDWKTARQVWAGKRANEEALQAGKKIFTDHVGTHQTALEKMSMSERDHYLIGALRAIEDKIMRKPDTGDLIRELRDTARGKEVVKLLFGGEKGFRSFLNMANVEEKMADTYARMQRGSATYGRAAKNTDLAEASGTILGLMFNIPGLPWLTRKLGGRASQAWSRADEMKRNAMADLLLSRNPQQLEQRLAKPPIQASPLSGVAGLMAASRAPGLLEE